MMEPNQMPWIPIKDTTNTSDISNLMYYKTGEVPGTQANGHNFLTINGV